MLSPHELRSSSFTPVNPVPRQYGTGGLGETMSFKFGTILSCASRHPLQTFLNAPEGFLSHRNWFIISQSAWCGRLAHFTLKLLLGICCSPPFVVVNKQLVNKVEAGCRNKVPLQ
jgi:hypothetical protein